MQNCSKNNKKNLMRKNWDYRN